MPDDKEQRGLRDTGEAAANQTETARQEEISTPQKDGEPQRVSLAETIELFKGQKIKLVLLPRECQEDRRKGQRRRLDRIYGPVRRLIKVYVESPREKRKELLRAELAKMEPKPEQE